MKYVPRPPTVYFGVPVDDLTMDETVDAIDDLVVDGRNSGRNHQVATVNVDFLAHAVEDEELRSLLQTTALNLPDGLPLVWGSRLAGHRLTERVAGADLVPRLAAESARRGWRIHFFGSAPGVSERALELIADRHPDAMVSAESGPMMSDVLDVDDHVLAGLADRKTDILCVALGNPKQERFIAAHAERLGIPVLIGIGGSLDMLVGDRKRAPLWAQRIGAEWIFRAAQEPKRLGKRYARDLVVFPPLLARYVRELRKDGAVEFAVTNTGEGLTVVPVDGANGQSSGQFADAIGQMARAAAPVRIDLGSDLASHRAIMYICGLIRWANNLGCRAEIAELSGALDDQLDRLDLRGWFHTLSHDATSWPGASQ